MDDPFWQYFFPELFRDQVYERKVESLGSGFIISEDGYVVTNEHVVGNAAEIIVTMTNGRRYEAHLVGSDYLTDIALLKIEGEDLPYIEFGDSDNLIVGEWVIALGNPFGLFELNDKPTVTVGVISAVDRDWGRTNDGRLYMDMIQTDAAINRGNSGGPLVNSLGQVIGMNAFIYTGSQYEQGFVGIGFAIPINKIKEVVAELRDRGQINRQYWLGIYDAQDVTPMIVAALELPVDYGVIISSLARNGPAYKAGLRQYDVIIEVQGTTVHNQREMLQVLRSSDLKVGDKIRVKAIRNGEVREFTITLEAMRNSR
ncbi:MAG: PDZ domain-containing protein [Calditrichaeota bacterium]|nr:MAG: PDZ domain-containing protein [Calditrichota bacterium]